jgi:hypothetical protein
MNTTMKTALVGLAVLFSGSVVAGSAETGSTGPVAAVLRFSGIANVPTQAGAAPAQFKLEIRNFSLVRSAEGVRLPADGFTVFQLKSGKIDTVISGKKEHRVAGSFWTVAEGEALTVTFPPHSEVAQLQTITVLPVGGP